MNNSQLVKLMIKLFTKRQKGLQGNFRLQITETYKHGCLCIVRAFSVGLLCALGRERKPKETRDRDHSRVRSGGGVWKRMV